MWRIVLFIVLVAGNRPPDVSHVGVAAVLAWARQRTTEAVTSYAGSRQASPSAWEDQNVYSVMIDRFANGNVTNDYLNVQFAQQQYFNTSSKSPYGLGNFRHGGDLAGISMRLSYLQDLGVTSLWLTPVFTSCGGEYHGYCPSSFTEVDPNWGTLSEYVSLVRSAHASGMYVVQDVIINHLCGCFTEYEAQTPDHEKCASVLDAQFWAGQIVGAANLQGNISFAPSVFGPFKSEYFFNRCGSNSAPDTTGTGPAAVYGDFVSTMLDFATYNQDFQQIFTEILKGWIALTDIDGFRLDAAKHVTEDFVAFLSTELRDFAKSIGKSNFFIVGEVAAPEDWIGRRLGKQFSDPTNPNSHGNVPAGLTKRLLELKSTYLNNSEAAYPGLDAVYDFDASGTSRDVLLGLRSAADIAEYYGSDYFNTIAGNGNPLTSWTHLEIHDWDRLQKGRSDVPTSIVAMAYLFAAPGQPIIWMGLEQGFNQDCHFDSMNASGATQSIQATCITGADDSLKRQDVCGRAVATGKRSSRN